MFLIIQTQTGGVGGTPNNSLLPATLAVDYLKVTQPWFDLLREAQADRSPLSVTVESYFSTGAKFRGIPEKDERTRQKLKRQYGLSCCPNSLRRLDQLEEPGMSS